MSQPGFVASILTCAWHDRVRQARQHWRPIVAVFLPFAFGFYLSYLFRSINALISGQLTSEFALSAGDLGLLTSLYFLSFGLVQLPAGVLLDRYGPRRIQSTLLLIAASGAVLFGTAQQFWELALGRTLLGLGVASSLIAGIKALVPWFPRERLLLVNGLFVAAGTLGAVTATVPAEALLSWTGWRGLFGLLAAATMACAAVIYLAVPDPPDGHRAGAGRGSIKLKAIYTDLRFWRVAPLSTACIGTASAIQGLWATPWLADVERLPSPAIVRHLLVMAIALSASALLLGIVSDRMHRRGVRPQSVLAFAATLFIVAQLALIAHWPISSYLLLGIVAGVGAVNVLSFAIIEQYFPKETVGQACAALSVCQIGGAFPIQYLIGMVVDLWPKTGGHYPAIAYEAAFSLNLALQVVALTWFLLANRQISALDSPDAANPSAAVGGRLSDVQGV